MKSKLTTALLFMLFLCMPAFAGQYESKYIGEEFRVIKSLSPDDIKQLNNGGGWGLAKAAELNGVPGPAHILEMGSKIGLTDDQKKKVQVIYKQMKKEAVDLGKQLIQREETLNRHFSDRTISQAILVKTVQDIENVRAKLRIVHLSTHLQTLDILTTEQISLYNELRGYSKDPCNHIPDGHNVEMWKKHNGCNL